MPIKCRIVYCLLAGVIVLTAAVSCGGGDTAKETPEPVSEKKARTGNEETTTTEKEAVHSATSPALNEALKNLSTISQPDIAVGKVPEDFPIEVIPLYPGAEIERAALQPNEATVLQTSADSEEAILAFYTKKFAANGFKKENFVNVGGRNLGGYKGPGCTIHMTLQAREDGKTFFSLVLDNG